MEKSQTLLKRERLEKISEWRLEELESLKNYIEAKCVEKYVPHNLIINEYKQLVFKAGNNIDNRAFLIKFNNSRGIDTLDYYDILDLRTSKICRYISQYDRDVEIRKVEVAKGVFKEMPFTKIKNEIIKTMENVDINEVYLYLEKVFDIFKSKDK